MLRERPKPAPRPEFVLDLRERLMTAAETDLVPATPVAAPARTGRNGRRRLATVAAAAVLVGGTAGIAAAAQGTLPGDSLYPVKRGLENVQLQLNTSDSARGHDLLAQASNRLQEAKNLLTEPPSADRDRLVDEALADAADSANDGADLLFTSYQRDRSSSDISAVRSFAADQMGVLSELADRAGVGSAQVGQVGDALAAIDQQARVLCSACSDLPEVSLPSDVLSLSSADTSLTQLVTVPTKRAERLERLAKLAQQVAAETKQPATGGSPSSTAPKRTGTISTEKDGGPAATTADSDPVHSLIKGLTGDSKSGLTGQVGTTLQGVTSGLGDIVDGTLGTVGGLLGGSQK